MPKKFPAKNFGENPHLKPSDHTNPDQKRVNLRTVNRGKLILLWLDVCRKRMEPVPSRYWPHVKKDFQEKADPYFREVAFKHNYNWTEDGLVVHTRTSKFGGEGFIFFYYSDPINVTTQQKGMDIFNKDYGHDTEE